MNTSSEICVCVYFSLTPPSWETDPVKTTSKEVLRYATQRCNWRSSNFVQLVTLLANLVTMNDKSGLVSRENPQQTHQDARSICAELTCLWKVLLCDGAFWNVWSGNTAEPFPFKSSDFTVSLDNAICVWPHVKFTCGMITLNFYVVFSTKNQCTFMAKDVLLRF